MTATGEKTAGLRKTNLITPSKSKYIMSVWTSDYDGIITFHGMSAFVVIYVIWNLWILFDNLTITVL